jgi:hypothetical protein
MNKQQLMEYRMKLAESDQPVTVSIIAPKRAKPKPAVKETKPRTRKARPTRR